MGLLETIDARAYLGTEFLTWIWYRAETGNGHFEIADLGSFDIEIDTAVTAGIEGDGDVKKVALRGDAPGASRLLKQAIGEGKIIEKASLRVVWENIAWGCALDGRTLDLSGIKLPVSAPQGGAAIAEHYRLRLETLEGFIDLFEGLFGYYMSVRLDEETWSTEMDQLALWLAEDLTEPSLG